MKKTILVLALLMSTSAHALEAGRYQGTQAGTTDDVLVVKKNGSMSLEYTRQVGGPGGIADAGGVPYPTVCRVKIWALVRSSLAGSFQYEVRKVQLIAVEGADAETLNNCQRYVAVFNERAWAGLVSFTRRDSEFKRVSNETN